MRRRTVLGTMGAFLAGVTGRRANAQDVPVRKAPLAEPEHQAMRKRLMDALPYPRVTVPGADALAEWERLRAAGKGWPVIIGGDKQLEALAELFTLDDPAAYLPPERVPANAGSPPGVEAILAKAASVKLPDALKEGEPDGDDGIAEMLAQWPAGEPAEPSIGLTVASDIMTGKPLDRVHILIVPTSDGSEVPAYLRYGGWNACPRPEVHVAVLRDWHRRYGAELIGMDGDTMNLRVARKPASREEALALAVDQFRYCPDIVAQGVNTIPALASLTMTEDWWFFWWD